MMALISGSLTPATHPLTLSVPSRARRNSGITTATPFGTARICAATTARSIPAQLRSKQAFSWPWLSVRKVVPDASTSAGPGTSDARLSVVEKGRPWA